MYLEKIKIKENYRCLVKGMEIKLRPLTLLVGEQGCGKSSLLNLLQQNKIDITFSKIAKGLKNGIEHFYFDSEKMNPRVSHIDNYSNMDGTNKGIGVGTALGSKFLSHGEVLREFTVNKIKYAKNCILLLDEPESALSLKNQYKLAKELKKAINRKVQIIASTHCLPLIESVDIVYNMEKMQWEKSEIFIKESKTNQQVNRDRYETNDYK